MPTPKKTASLTSDQKIAALEKAFLKQAAEHEALKKTVQRQAAELGLLRGGQRDLAECLDDTIDAAEKRIVRRVIEELSFEKYGRLNRKLDEAAAYVYPELRRMREQAAGLAEGFRRIGEAVAETANHLDAFGRQLAEVEAARPALESSRERADRAVEQIQEMMADPRLAHAAGGGAAPAVAASAGSPASAFPADGLVKMAMGEIGGKPCPVVDARELHGFFGSKEDFPTWIKYQLERTRLKENKHFEVFRKIPENLPKGGRPRIDYLLTLNGAMHVAMAANTDKAFEVRDYFIECEERLREILSNPAQAVAAQPTHFWPEEEIVRAIEALSHRTEHHDCRLGILPAGQSVLEKEVADFVVRTATLKADLALALGRENPGPENAPPSESALVRHYSGADCLFMACIALVGGRQAPVVIDDGEGNALVTNMNPDNALLKRNARALAYLIRHVPRHVEGLRFKQGELAGHIGLSAWHFKAALKEFEARGFLAIVRVGKPSFPAPGFELRMHWDDIEAAARRDGVDLAALAGAPPGAVRPAALAQRG